MIGLDDFFRDQYIFASKYVFWQIVTETYKLLQEKM
jgi:hypothetical protein